MARLKRTYWNPERKGTTEMYDAHLFQPSDIRMWGVQWKHSVWKINEMPVRYSSQPVVTLNPHLHEPAAQACWQISRSLLKRRWKWHCYRALDKAQVNLRQHETSKAQTQYIFLVQTWTNHYLKYPHFQSPKSRRTIAHSWWCEWSETTGTWSAQVFVLNYSRHMSKSRSQHPIPYLSARHEVDALLDLPLRAHVQLVHEELLEALLVLLAHLQLT